MNDELIKRLRRWANFGYGVNASKCMIEACDALEASNTVMSKANAALEAANARIAELEAAAKATGQAVLREERIAQIAHYCETEAHACPGTNMWQCAHMAVEETLRALAEPYLHLQIAEVCEDADGFKHIESVIEDLDDLPKGMKLYTASTAALAQPLEAQADARWQPIETAPKDGTPIVIACIDDDTVFDVCNGHFEVLLEDEDDGPWDIRDGEPWCSYVGRQAGTYFCCWLPGKEWERGWKVPDDFEYTHWMPLPAAPSALSQKAGEQQ